MIYTNPALIDVAVPNDNLKLFHGDFKVVSRKYIPDNSINLIFTDPAYDKQHLNLYEALGTEGFRVLKECGSLLTYAPHNALSEIFGCMNKSGLSYRWMFAIIDGTGATWMQEQKLWVGWKPILWFVKGNNVKSANDIFDIVRSQSIDKALNIWEQPTIESDYFIQHLTEENETVLDPMMGSGTTGISALKLGRKFIGIDSPNMVKEKYLDGNILIAQRMGLPSLLQQSIIVSNGQVELAKKCVILLSILVSSSCHSLINTTRPPPLFSSNSIHSSNRCEQALSIAK